MSQEMMMIRFAIKSTELANVIRKYSSEIMNDNEDEEGDINLDDFIDADYEGNVYADCNNITIGSLVTSEYDEMGDIWRPDKETPKGKNITGWLLDVICCGDRRNKLSKEGKDYIRNNLELLDESIEKYKVIHLEYLPWGQSSVYYEMYDGDSPIAYEMTPDKWERMWGKKNKAEAQGIFEKYNKNMDDYSLDGVFAGDVFWDLYELPVFIQLMRKFGDKKKYVKSGCNDNSINDLLNALDKNSIDPKDIDFQNKIVLTDFSHIDGEGIYSYDAERYKDIDKSFLDGVGDEYEKVRLWREYLVGLYDSAIYKTGAAILQRDLSTDSNNEIFDYIVVTRSMEETFKNRHLESFRRGEFRIFFGEDSDPEARKEKEEWEQSKKERHKQLLNEEYSDYLAALLNRVEETNKKRSSLDEQLEPTKIIWEDQLIQYFESNKLLLESNAGCEPDPKRREVGKKALDVFAKDLLSRYTDDKYVTSQDQLISENPDLEGKIGFLKYAAKKLFDISFANYLRDKGVIRNKNGKRIETNEFKEPFLQFGIIRFLLLPINKKAYTNLAFKSEHFFGMSEEQLRNAAKGITSLSMLVSNIEEITKKGVFSESGVKKNDYNNIFVMDKKYPLEHYKVFAIKYESSSGVRYDIRDF